MIREGARRLWMGALLGLALVVAGLLLPLVLLVGRRANAAEAGSSASCLLNAMCGGPRTATFSAWSWERRRRQKWDGILRVWVVDRLPFNTIGHCEGAWTDHRARGLV